MAGILIAEDEQRISSFVAKGLRAAGYATTMVATGADALSHAQTGEFDLLVHKRLAKTIRSAVSDRQGSGSQHYAEA